jgi:preprotein translocase subunit SecD
MINRILIILALPILVTFYACATPPIPSQIITLKADLSEVALNQRDNVMQAEIKIIESRLQGIGVTKFDIEPQGADEIVVKLFGASIIDQQKARLTSSALLEFGELATNNERAKWENELGRWKPATALIDGEEKALTSRYFKNNTYVTTDNQGTVFLVFEWDEEGSKLSEAITTRLIDKPLGIFEGDEALRGEDGQPIAPIVRGVINDKGQIEGLSLKEATALSKQLNAGRLPVPLKVVE